MLISENLIEVSVEIQPDKPTQDRFELFSHASGDWKVVLDDDSWWVVGYHLAYPARDRDDAQRLREELSRQHKRSEGRR